MNLLGPQWWLSSLGLWSWLCYRGRIIWKRHRSGKNFSAALQSFQNKALVLELVFWSLLTQFTAIVVPASVGYFSVGGGFELAMQLAAITPVVWLITMLPIALGGNGLREASYVAIAELLGMNTTIALTASLALTISNLLPSLVGIFIFQRFRSSHPITSRRTRSFLPLFKGYR